VLDQQVWLVEARWTGEPADPKEVRDFGGKLATRPGRILGLFVSVAGFTPGAVAYPKENRAVGMLLLDAGHLRRVLDGTERLDHLLRRLHRHLIETGESYEPDVERERLPAQD